MPPPPSWPTVRFRPGEVVIAGAGPGPADLATARALAYLRLADTIVHDRLIDRTVFRWARPGSEQVDVGKERPVPVGSQAAIHRLLAARAREGRRVLRWKGGDPFVYGRGFEEVRYLSDRGIPVTVVPGVSSVTAVPAAIGIPLVSRGVARTFSVFSGEPSADLARPGSDLTALARASDTVVGLMVMGALDLVVDRLLRARGPREPAALIADGWGPRQRSVHATLGTLVAAARRAGLVPPAVLVVGRVAKHPSRRRPHRPPRRRRTLPTRTSSPRRRAA